MPKKSLIKKGYEDYGTVEEPFLIDLTKINFLKQSMEGKKITGTYLPIRDKLKTVDIEVPILKHFESNLQFVELASEIGLKSVTCYDVSQNKYNFVINKNELMVMKKHIGYKEDAIKKFTSKPEFENYDGYDFVFKDGTIITLILNKTVFIERLPTLMGIDLGNKMTDKIHSR